MTKLIKKQKFAGGGGVGVIPVTPYPKVGNAPELSKNLEVRGEIPEVGLSKDEIDAIYAKYANDKNKWENIAQAFGYKGGRADILRLLKEYNQRLRDMGGDPVKANSNYVIEDGKLGRLTFDMLFGHRAFDMPEKATRQGGVVSSTGTPKNLLSPEGQNKSTSANATKAAELNKKYYTSAGRLNVGQSAGRAGANGWGDPDLSNWWANTGYKLQKSDKSYSDDDLIREYVKAYLPALLKLSGEAYKRLLNKNGNWEMGRLKADKTFMRNFEKWRDNQGLVKSNALIDRMLGHYIFPKAQTAPHNSSVQRLGGMRGTY